MKNSKHGLSKGTAVSESMKKIVNEQRFLSIAEVNQTILSAFEKKDSMMMKGFTLWLSDTLEQGKKNLWQFFPVMVCSSSFKMISPAWPKNAMILLLIK